MGQEFGSVVNVLAGTGPSGFASNSQAWQVGAGGWREVSVSLHASIFTGLFRYPRGSLQSEQCKKRQKCSFFLWPSLGNQHQYLLSILLVTQISHDSLWEGTVQRHKYQKAKIIGGYFGDWLPHLVSKDSVLGTVGGVPRHPGPAPVTL